MNPKTVEPCSTRIRKALSIRNMTQTELCAKAKISKSSLSEYLNGKHEPGQDKVFILAQALNVDPVWLWGYDVPMEIEDVKKDSPDKVELTEGDKLWLDLIREMPEDFRQRTYEMIRTALDSPK